jgi:valyl-tRNA synthetase
LEAFPLELDAWTDAEAAAEMDLALEVTRAVRALRKRVGGGGSDVGSCVVLADNEARVRLTCSRYQVSAAVSPAGLDVAARLARAAGQLAKTEFGPDAGGLQEVLKDGLGSVRLVLGTDGGGAAESVAQRVEEERGRLRDRLAKLDKQLAKLQVVHDARVPAAVREKELARAAALRHQLAAVRLALDGLSSLA